MRVEEDRCPLTSGAKGQLLNALMINAQSLISSCLICLFTSMRSSGGRFGSVRGLRRVWAPGANDLPTKEKKKGGSQVNINIVILTGHRGGERSHVPNSSLQTLPFQHKQPPQTIIPLFQRRAPDELSLMRQHAHSHHRMPYPPTIGFFRWFVRLEHRRVEMFVVRE